MPDAAQQIPQVIVLSIAFDPHNPKGVQVNGPLQDKMICYALLEMARDAIKDYVPPMVQVAAAMPANMPPPGARQ
jgi:hypothetical protein